MSIYDFQATRPNGEVLSLGEFQDQVVLIVNTASQCGFTYQYGPLQALYEKYKEQGLVVLGFPSNQFGEQNPEGSVKTEEACQVNFGVTFPIFEVTKVNGDQQHPLFGYLKQQVPYHTYGQDNELEGMLYKMFVEEFPELLEGNTIRWNFTKFLVNRQGEVVARIEPFETIEALEQKISQLL